MNKLVAFAAGIAMFGSVAFAEAHSSTVNCSTSAYHGFYLGVQAGPNITTGKYRSELSFNGAIPGSVATSITKNSNQSIQKYAFAGGIFGGYGWVFSQNGYLGLEAYVSYDSTKANIILDNDTSASAAAVNPDVRAGSFGRDTLRRTYFYGLNGHVGYLFTKETMGYLILGIEGGKWKLRSWRLGSPSGQLTGFFSRNKHRFSFKPGLGFRHALTHNVFLRMEWTVSFNPKIGASAAQSVTATEVFAAKNVKTKNLVQNGFMLGVGYKF